MRKFILPGIAAVLLVAWVAIVARLTIADVWDETLGLSIFYQHFPLSGDAYLFKTTRPVPILFLRMLFHVVHDPEAAWRLARAFNAMMVLGSLALMLAALRHLKVTDDGRKMFALVAYIFSASAIITATWFANLYDASALILIWTGIFLLTATDYEILPAFLFGIAFFCKETAVLIFPFVFILAWNGTIDRRRASVNLGFAAAFLLAYIAFRIRVVPFGGAGDIHGFKKEEFVPSMIGWLESFWWQTLKRPGPALGGAFALGISLLANRSGRIMVGLLGMLVLCGCLYWGMLGEYQADLLSNLNFIGRLYLIPFSFFIFVLALDGRRWALPVLLVPLALGFCDTVRDHRKFQEAFRTVYDMAAARPADHPLKVRYAGYPGAFADERRRLVIGRVPGAEFRLEAEDGRLVPIAGEKP